MYEWALIALRSLSYKAASTHASNSAAARSRYIPYSVVAKVGFHAGILALYKTAFGRLLTDWLLIPVDPMETLGTGGYRELPRSPRRIFGTPIPPEIPPRLIGYHWILMDVSGHAMS
jgi:hypothetical protein